MIKKSYETGSNPVEVGPSADLVDKETATETATETGARGFNLIEMTSDYDHTDPDKYEENLEPEYYSQEQVLPEEISNLLIELGDEMDKKDEEHLANFADFLLQKIAETQNIDYPELFNKLMIKINNADLVNRNEIIKKLAKIYSRTLVLEYMNNQDIKKSRESAYKKTLHRAEQYLSEV